jgi:membrane-bound serine protease (ClpP class)
MPLLTHLQNPNVSIPVFLLGLLLVYLDFNIPGKVLPAAAGTLLLCLSVFGLIHTPILRSALLLTFAAVFLILLELPRPTHNVLATVGTGALAYGLFHLTNVPNATRHVHLLTALFSATVFSVVTLKLGRIALQARRNKAVPGTID